MSMLPKPAVNSCQHVNVPVNVSTLLMLIATRDAVIRTLRTFRAGILYVHSARTCRTHELERVCTSMHECADATRDVEIESLASMTRCARSACQRNVDDTRTAGCSDQECRWRVDHAIMMRKKGHGDKVACRHVVSRSLTGGPALDDVACRRTLQSIGRTRQDRRTRQDQAGSGDQAIRHD